MTVGLRNCACCDDSNKSGVRPSTVVSVVSSTGRKRSTTASTIAERQSRFLRYSSIVLTRIIESLMMMPVMPIRPTTENTDSGTSQCQCPNNAPVRPKGITDITTMGRDQR